MLFRPVTEDPLNEVDYRLERANASNADLFGLVLDKACPRLGARNPAELDRLHRLLQTGAYTDAALALIDAELPSWHLRRLVFDAGEWYCVLSRTRWAPLEFDDTAESHHACLPLALLGAFVEARRSRSVKSGPMPTALPLVQADHSLAVCCDNFS
jgi:hypothetical protein